jgi:hypothetical protein
VLLAKNDIAGAQVQWEAALQHDSDNRTAQMYLRMAKNPSESKPPPAVDPASEDLGSLDDDE